MSSRRGGRTAWIVALGAIALVAVWWLLAGGPRGEDESPAGRPAAPVAQPDAPLELPVPPAARPSAATVVPEPATMGVDAAAAATAPVAADAKPAARLRVLVVDPAGRPVPGAIVVTNHLEPRLTTDADGVALFEVVPGEALRVAATQPDFRLVADAIAIANEPGAETELRLQLGEGLQVCLEVQARDGRPIEGACVRLREGFGRADTKEVNPLGPENVQLGDDHDHVSGELMEMRATDAAGRCCVNGVRSGPITIHVDAAGFVQLRSQRFDVDADGGDLGVIVLEPAVRLTGVVEDAQGPVPDAVVVYRALFIGRATSAADGSFVLDGLASSPARVELHVSHPERGQFYDRDLTFAEQPVHVVLVPDLDVRFELSDARTDEPIDGEAKVEWKVPTGILMAYGFPKTLAVEAGRLELRDLAYFVEKVVLRVESYDVVELPMATILADPDRVLELKLTRPTLLLVRVYSAGTGELLRNVRLSVSQVFHAQADRVSNHNFLLQTARFDSQAGGFVLAESDLGIASSDEVSLFAEARGYATGKSGTIGENGRRICADTIDLFLEHE